MKTFRNDFREDRVVPTLGYHLVPDGGTIQVEDDQWEHWAAGGWTALDPKPEAPAQEQPEAAETAPPPPAAPKPAAKAAAPAPGGTETA